MYKILKHCTECGKQLPRMTEWDLCSACYKRLNEEDEKRVKKIQEEFAKAHQPDNSFTMKAGGSSIDLSRVKFGKIKPEDLKIRD